MPIYEFDCAACGDRFEELTSATASPPCPACGAEDVRRVLSQVAPTPRIGLRGAAARRSDAARRAREEKKREGRAKGKDGGPG